MSPHCVWIITVGGRVDTKTLIVTFPNIFMLTELGKYIYIFVYKCTLCEWYRDIQESVYVGVAV